jgi:hypothetical protein
MPIYRSRSMASAGWKSISSALIRESSLRSMVASISRIRSRTGVTDARDQLLQENGYLVLRYLAEDLVKELDSVLDGILRSLSSRRAAVVSTHTLNIVRGSRP